MGFTAPDLSDGRSMRERMLAGDLYRPDEPELVALSRTGMERCQTYNQIISGDAGEHVPLLDEMLASVGHETFVLPPFLTDYGVHVSIGDRCFVNMGAVFLDTCRITIGDDVMLATNVQLLTATHPLDYEARVSGWELGAPITIEDGAWLGGGVIVLPGVTIGARSVVGAGAVVTKDVAPDVLVVGNPARVVRTLNGT
jgi:maltose O-acetyltransferase